MRPIAGIIIAHYADKIGRKKLFVLTVLLMSVPTFLMGLLPTYALIGWLAPAALLLLRILQGCALGGELPGASVFISEHAPSQRLGLSSGTFQGVVNCGLLLGAGAAAVSSVVAALDPALASLAWRMPFVIGGLFGLMAADLRRHLAESPMFESIKQERGLSKQTPLVVVLGNYRAQCVVALALVFVFSTTSGVYFQYLPPFLVTQLHFAQPLVFAANIVGVIAFVLGMPIWGWVRDRFGWSRTIAASAILNAAICVWVLPCHPDPRPGRRHADLCSSRRRVGGRLRARHGARPDLLPLSNRGSAEWLRPALQHRHSRVHWLDAVVPRLARS